MQQNSAKSTDPFEIETTEQSAEFKKFLALDDNERILFSGIFGIGKTFFLRKFFEQNKEKYVTLHLYPTNYSVATNEDIFEYIKFDVLFELLGVTKGLEKTKISLPEAILRLNAEEQHELLMKFVETIPGIGKQVTDIINPLKEIWKQIRRKSVIADDKQTIDDFEKLLRQKKGSIYENDLYTELITKLILQLKLNENKEVVIVVDDLDRIDPEHIFRILNVFSVHFDGLRFYEYRNKFNVNKIVLCCDINNIRMMFEQKYGIHTDFNGYIDKFYSREIYHFDNRVSINKAVDKLINSITFVSDNVKLQLQISVAQNMLCSIIKSMIVSGSLNLRTILKFYQKTVTISKNYFYFNGRRFTNTEIWVTQILGVIRRFFDTDRGCISALERIKFIDVSPTAQTELHNNLILISEASTHGFNLSRDIPYHSGQSYRLRKYNDQFIIDETSKIAASVDDLGPLLKKSMEVYLKSKQ